MKKVIFILSTITLLSCSGESIEGTNDQNLSLDNNISSNEGTTASRVLPNNNVPKESIPVTKELIAGQNYNIGTVTADVVDEVMIVTYDITDPSWIMTVSHLFVGECGTQPVTGSGNPKVGHFTYQRTYVGGVNTDEYEIEEYLEEGCIAAHAVVINTVTGQEETAWADGVSYGMSTEEGEGNSWATIFGYTL